MKNLTLQTATRSLGGYFKQQQVMNRTCALHLTHEYFCFIQFLSFFFFFGALCYCINITKYKCMAVWIESGFYSCVCVCMFFGYTKAMTLVIQLLSVYCFFFYCVQMNDDEMILFFFFGPKNRGKNYYFDLVWRWKKKYLFRLCTWQFCANIKTKLCETNKGRPKK